MYNRAKELYCDATIFVFFYSLLSTCQKKMENKKWPKAADSPLHILYILFRPIFTYILHEL